MSKDSLVLRIREGKSVNLSEVENFLVRADDVQRREFLKEVLVKGVPDFNEIIKEVMLFETDPTIRTLCFAVISKTGNRSSVDDLLEVVGTEISDQHRYSMLDMLKLFIDKHRIQLENMSVHSERLVGNEASKPQVSILSEDVEDTGKRRFLDYVYDMPPDIPISIHRLSQILNIELSSLRKYLKQFVKQNPDAAEFLEFEQVFIKSQTTVRKLIDESEIRSVSCLNCGVSTTSFPCDNCGNGTQCITCRLVIGEGEEMMACPYCASFSHKKHIVEWVRIRGICPSCKHDLKHSELIS